MTQPDEPSSQTRSSPSSDFTNRKTPAEVDAIFTCLAHQRRRRLVAFLSERSGPIVVEEIVQHLTELDAGGPSASRLDDEDVEIAVSLLHKHLPKLDEAGVVDVDTETRTVRKGRCFDVATSLLEMI